MKHDFEWPVVPHPIDALNLGAIGSTAFYVGDGKTNWALATYSDHVWKHASTHSPLQGMSIEPKPAYFLTPADYPKFRAACAEPRAGWDCGNRGLAARYLLLLIERNPHLSIHQLEWIYHTIDQAGPGFAQARLNFFTAPLDEEMPF